MSYVQYFGTKNFPNLENVYEMLSSLIASDLIEMREVNQDGGTMKEDRRMTDNTVHLAKIKNSMIGKIVYRSIDVMKKQEMHLDCVEILLRKTRDLNITENASIQNMIELSDNYYAIAEHYRFGNRPIDSVMYYEATADVCFKLRYYNISLQMLHRCKVLSKHTLALTHIPQLLEQRETYFKLHYPKWELYCGENYLQLDRLPEAMTHLQNAEQLIISIKAEQKEAVNSKKKIKPVKEKQYLFAKKSGKLFGGSWTMKKNKKEEYAGRKIVKTLDGLLYYIRSLISRIKNLQEYVDKRLFRLRNKAESMHYQASFHELEKLTNVNARKDFHLETQRRMHHDVRHESYFSTFLPVMIKPTERTNSSFKTLNTLGSPFKTKFYGTPGTLESHDNQEGFRDKYSSMPIIESSRKPIKHAKSTRTPIMHKLSHLTFKKVKSGSITTEMHRKFQNKQWHLRIL